jgi:hypothetical protein
MRQCTSTTAEHHRPLSAVARGSVVPAADDGGASGTRPHLERIRRSCPHEAPEQPPHFRHRERQEIGREVERCPSPRPPPGAGRRGRRAPASRRSRGGASRSRSGPRAGRGRSRPRIGVRGRLFAASKQASMVQRVPATRTRSASEACSGERVREKASSPGLVIWRLASSPFGQPWAVSDRYGSQTQSSRRGPLAPSPALKRFQARAGTSSSQPATGLRPSRWALVTART